MLVGARRATRSEPCVGRPDGIVQEEWEAELGAFLVWLWCSFFLESSTRLLLKRRLRLRSHVCWARRRAILFYARDQRAGATSPRLEHGLIAARTAQVNLLRACLYAA